jgi:hypothetical protein
MLRHFLFDVNETVNRVFPPCNPVQFQLDGSKIRHASRKATKREAVRPRASVTADSRSHLINDSSGWGKAV